MSVKLLSYHLSFSMDHDSEREHGYELLSSSDHPAHLPMWFFPYFKKFPSKIPKS